MCLTQVRPSSSFRRVQKCSVAFDPNWTRARISKVGFRDSIALPVVEVKLVKSDLCRDEFHRRRQLAKLTVEKFVELGFITSEDLIDDMMAKHLIHPFKVVAVGTMFDRNKSEVRK